MIWELRCWRTLRAQKRAREIKPPFCFLITSHFYSSFERRLRINRDASAMDTRWSIKIDDGHAKQYLFTRDCYDAVLSVVSVDRESLLLFTSMNILDTPKFDTFYRVFKNFWKLRVGQTTWLFTFYLFLPFENSGRRFSLFFSSSFPSFSPISDFWKGSTSTKYEPLALSFRLAIRFPRLRWPCLFNLALIDQMAWSCCSCRSQT